MCRRALLCPGDCTALHVPSCSLVSLQRWSWPSNGMRAAQGVQLITTAMQADCLLCKLRYSASTCACRNRESVSCRKQQMQALAWQTLQQTHAMHGNVLAVQTLIEHRLPFVSRSQLHRVVF